MIQNIGKLERFNFASSIEKPFFSRIAFNICFHRNFIFSQNPQTQYIWYFAELQFLILHNFQTLHKGGFFKTCRWILYDLRWTVFHLASWKLKFPFPPTSDTVQGSNVPFLVKRPFLYGENHSHWLQQAWNLSRETWAPLV